MPFDKNLKKSNPRFTSDFRLIPPDIWNSWKNDYEARIDKFEKNYPNGSHYGVQLKYDYQSVFFEKKTIETLINTHGVSDNDFVIFKFISKKQTQNTNLRITPCIMEYNSNMIKVNSNKIGHKIKGKTDNYIPTHYNYGNYEERLNYLNKLNEFKHDVQGIGHSVAEFKEWFKLSQGMNEFAVILLLDDSSFFYPLVLIRKMNIGFINADEIPTPSISISQYLNVNLYDEGQSCCPIK